jgi:hypothetical protein
MPGRGHRVIVTGGRTITWNAAFKKAADGAGTANQKGATSFVYDGTNWVQVGGVGGWDGRNGKSSWMSVAPTSRPSAKLIPRPAPPGPRSG